MNAGLKNPTALIGDSIRPWLGLLMTVAVVDACTSVMDGREFSERKGNLVEAWFTASDSTEATITHTFFLINDRNDTVRGSIRRPRNVECDERYPVALLVVGIETGRRVVTMIEGYEHVIVVGIDYPGDAVLDVAGSGAIRSIRRMRSVGFRTVPQIGLCVDWLSSLSHVDTNSITLVAVSFGVFTGVVATSIDPRIDRLVVVQGGGNLATIIAANAERLGVGLPSWMAGWIGQIVLAPFEPNRYVGNVSPRPMLLVSGESDRFFPRSSVESLYEHAREPKQWIRHHSGHVMPGEQELVRELTNLVAERLYGEK
jgi:hypothetical protein